MALDFGKVKLPRFAICESYAEPTRFLIIVDDEQADCARLEEVKVLIRSNRHPDEQKKHTYSVHEVSVFLKTATTIY